MDSLASLLAGSPLARLLEPPTPLVRQRIKSLACSSLAVEITLNKEVPRV